MNDSRNLGSDRNLVGRHFAICSMALNSDVPDLFIISP